MVPKDEMCSDMEAVKAANPLSSITIATLAEDFATVSDLGEWKRLKCNRPTRSSQSAITDKEWDDAEAGVEIPVGASVDVGLDVAFKRDTTAFVPLYGTRASGCWARRQFWFRRVMARACIRTRSRTR
jgi:hypothetical protein